MNNLIKRIILSEIVKCDRNGLNRHLFWNKISFNTNQTAVSHSTLPQHLNNDLSDNYQKDLPDPNLPNPYLKENRKCILCKYGIEIDYKNVRLLSQFVSPYTGKIYEKHITGLCETQHKVLRRELTKAYRYYLMSPVFRDTKYCKDPRLFDPSKPQRPNPY